jgi:glycosyl transferase family 25
MKLYSEMLNIERAKDRKELMCGELKKKNIEAYFHKAVDYKDTKKEDILLECLQYGPWGQFHIQNMAATLSHSRAWERFLQSDADICFIMEDDIFISDDLEHWLNDLSWLPADADIIKLECWVEKLNKKGAILFEKPGISHLNRKVKRLLTRHMGAAGYLLTRRAAKKLLASKPFDMVIDQMLFNINASKVAKNMKIYQILPALVLQGNEPVKRTVYMGNRQNASGIKFFKQELRRGLYEISVPLKTIIKFIVGKASFEKITYKNNIS